MMDVFAQPLMQGRRMSVNMGEGGRDLAPTALQCSKEFELIYKIGEAPTFPISAVSAVMPK